MSLRCIINDFCAAVEDETGERPISIELRPAAFDALLLVTRLGHLLDRNLDKDAVLVMDSVIIIRGPHAIGPVSSGNA